MARHSHLTQIYLTEHAALRFEERTLSPWEDLGLEQPVSKKRRMRAKQKRLLVKQIRSRLLAALKRGVTLKNQSIHLGLTGGYKAVLVPGFTGWIVLTILQPVIPSGAGHAQGKGFDNCCSI